MFPFFTSNIKKNGILYQMLFGAKAQEEAKNIFCKAVQLAQNGLTPAQAATHLKFIA
jgi:hypothetical protein